jgi:hypothetical protein
MAFSKASISTGFLRILIASSTGKKGRVWQKKTHKVQFEAHRTVKEEVPVKFRTRGGERISFEAKKKIKEPVHVKFTSRNK